MCHKRWVFELGEGGNSGKNRQKLKVIQIASKVGSTYSATHDV